MRSLQHWNSQIRPSVPPPEPELSEPRILAFAPAGISCVTSKHEGAFSSSSPPPPPRASKHPGTRADTDVLSAPRNRTKEASSSLAPTIQKGTGRITTSGTVVSGHDTKFEKEISVGDAILVTLPGNDAEEMRVVTMRLSNASLNLSSAFSRNLVEPHGFRYVRKPRNPDQERREERQKQLEEAEEVERRAFDIYGKGDGSNGRQNIFTYREKTETGSYRVKQQTASQSETTRGRLLALRSKKTSDKYC
mmetsp:Transcript_2846/g.6162  ORF Transcript_2846/g.6162 Transcript_2846/m.6162 type:complete len:249 (+) Transcript_2846:784-1530(+)